MRIIKTRTERGRPETEAMRDYGYWQKSRSQPAGAIGKLDNNDSEDTAVKVQCEWLNKKISIDNDSLQKF